MDILIYLLTIGQGVIVLIGILYVFKFTSNFIIKKKFQKYNVIPLIHKYKIKQSLFRKDDIEDQMININTYFKFLKYYEKTNKDEDINIIIQTSGGSATFSEAICYRILNHKGKGKIKCYIPNYAFSGGWLIALCCDEIIMSENTIVTPCDGQLLWNDDKTYSASSISEAVKYKQNLNQTIKEAWLATNAEATKFVERHKKLIEKIGKIKSYKSVDILYTEFFSGKYNHDHIFTTQDIIELNSELKVTKIDKVPIYIEKLLEHKLK